MKIDHVALFCRDLEAMAIMRVASSVQKGFRLR